jgi:colanic acid/amylovoran biosynthesis glycosyltransferase
MLENKLSILFWIHTFPRFSETFIRDQVCRLLDEGCDVFIYGKSFVANEKEALKGYEKYNLIKRFVSKHDVRKTKTNKYIDYLKKVYFLSCHKRFSTKKYLSYMIKNRTLNVQSVCISHFCLKNDISIIHSHFGPNGELATVLKQLGLQIKIVTTFHGYDVRLGLETPGVYKTLKKLGDVIISISPYNKKILLDIGFNPDVIYDLPNAIQTDFYCPKLKNQADSEVIPIITVGRLVEEKSIHIAIQALKNVRDIAPQYDFRYTIVGEGELRKPIEALVKEVNLQDRVTLVGVKNSLEVRDALQEAAIFILSSSREAFPTVLMEAQSTGLVVIATDVGSVSNIAVHGTVIPSNDIEAMTDAIITTFEDKVNWEAKGLQNRDYIVSNYDSHVLTQKLIAIYNE